MIVELVSISDVQLSEWSLHYGEQTVATFGPRYVRAARSVREYKDDIWRPVHVRRDRGHVTSIEH